MFRNQKKKMWIQFLKIIPLTVTNLSGEKRIYFSAGITRREARVPVPSLYLGAGGPRGLGGRHDVVVVEGEVGDGVQVGGHHEALRREDGRHDQPRVEAQLECGVRLWEEERRRQLVQATSVLGSDLLSRPSHTGWQVHVEICKMTWAIHSDADWLPRTFTIFTLVILFAYREDAPSCIKYQ